MNYTLYHIIIYNYYVMTTYAAFLENLDKYHIYEVMDSEKICLLNDTNLLKFNHDYRYDFKTLDKDKYEVKTDELSLKQITYSLNLKDIIKSLEYQFQKRIIIYFATQLIIML